MGREVIRWRLCTPLDEGATPLSFLITEEADLFDNDKNTETKSRNELVSINNAAACEGMLDGFERNWTGPLSGAQFGSRMEGNDLLLSMTIEGQNSMCFHNRMDTPILLRQHADSFDFALYVSMDETVPDADIKDNLMRLCWTSNFLLESYLSLDNSLKKNISQMEKTLNNQRAARDCRLSINRIKVIVDRIEARLENCAPNGRLATIRNISPQIH
jgi:hypothetical protein